MIALRAGCDALRSDNIRFLDIGPADRLLAYVRPGVAKQDDVLVLLNWSGAPLAMTLPGRATDGALADLLGGQSLARGASITLPPYGLRSLAER